MKRRTFLKKAIHAGTTVMGVLATGCGALNPPNEYVSKNNSLASGSPVPTPKPTPTADPISPTPSSSPTPPPGSEVLLYDTYAKVSLSGSGFKSIVIEASKVRDGVPWQIQFDYGHPGSIHTAVIGPSEIEAFKSLRKVQITASATLFHSHTVTIDFSDAAQRVPGAKPVKIGV